MNKKKPVKEVEKYQGVNDLTRMTVRMNEVPERGINVYYLSQLMNVNARGRDGNLISSNTENPYFFLTPEDRSMIVQLCAPIQGLLTSRAHRISGSKITISPDKKVEDRIVEQLKSMKEIWKEFNSRTEIEYIVARAKIYSEVKYYLKELFIDFTNLDSCLLRWKKKINFDKVDKSNEIFEWLQIDFFVHSSVSQ